MKEQRPRSPLASAAAVLFSVILVLGMTPLSALADQGAQNGQTSDAIELTASDDAVIADAGWYSHPEIKASMFKVAKVYLHSDGTEQYAWLVMETQSYGYAYVGSAADGNSVVASEGLSSDKLIPATQVSLDYGDGSDPETVNAFKVPIASLDQDLNISFYSNKNKKFYDRTVRIQSSKLSVCDNPGYGPVIARAGWYEHPAVSSGKYFKALKTYLQSDGASQYAVIVMGSSTYTYAYVGSAADGDAEVAANGLTSDKIIPAYEVKYDYNDGTDPETVTAFKVPISSLDQDLNIAFYSKNKNTFYDRTIRLNTSGLTACEEPTAYLPVVSAPRVERLSGALSDDTAAAIAARAYEGEKSEYVVISRDDTYYDALSGAGLAGALGAPILLTGTSGLSGACRSAVESLGATKAVVLGGENAVSGQVVSELEAMGLSVERVAGADVYGTSMACTRYLLAHGGSQRYAIACNPTSFVDAVSISGWAYANRVPVMLQTWGGSAAERGFDAEAASVIAGRDLIVCGGEMAVSDGSVSNLGAASVTRLGGDTLYDTNLQIVGFALENGMSASDVAVASDIYSFSGVDALAASALAGRRGGVVLLAQSNPAYEPAPETSAALGFISAHASEVSRVHVLGGEVAQTPEFYQQIEDALS